MALANKVKQVTKMQQSDSSASEYYQRNRREIANSCLAPTEVVAAVEHMKESFSVQNVVIRRGMYPLTDAMMDDNFSILQQELEFCASCLKVAAEEKSRHTGATGRGTREVVAMKYSKWQTDILMKWVIKHKDDPFPNQHDLDNLIGETGLAREQIVNWTTNVRKRSRKATLSGKKPHHFVDFVFLAQQRDDAKRFSNFDPSRNPTSCRRKPKKKTMTPSTLPNTPPRPPTTPTSSLYSTPSVYQFGATPPSTPGYYSTPYIPYTPPSQGLPASQYSQYYSGHSDHQWSAHTKKRSRQVYEIPSAETWQSSTLKSVTESFEDPSNIDEALEPMAIDVDADQAILSIFAENWQIPLSSDEDIVLPPPPSASNVTAKLFKTEDDRERMYVPAPPTPTASNATAKSCKMKGDMEMKDSPQPPTPNVSTVTVQPSQTMGDVEMKDLPAPDVDPPGLAQASSFEFEELDMESVAKEAGIKLEYYGIPSSE
jgi:hypothetical protein